jgi:hypothetical protein
MHVLSSVAGEPGLDGACAGTRVQLPVVEGQQEQEQELAAGELGGHTGAHGGPFDDHGHDKGQGKTGRKNGCNLLPARGGGG